MENEDEMPVENAAVNQLRSTANAYRDEARHKDEMAIGVHRRLLELRVSARNARAKADAFEEAALRLENTEAVEVVLKVDAKATADAIKVEGAKLLREHEAARNGAAWMHSRTYARLLKANNRDLYVSDNEWPTYKGRLVYVHDHMPDDGKIYDRQDANARVVDDTAVKAAEREAAAEKEREQMMAREPSPFLKEDVRTQPAGVEEAVREHMERREPYYDPEPKMTPEPDGPLDNTETRPKSRKGEHTKEQYTKD